MSSAGNKALDSFDKLGSAADSSYEDVVSGAEEAAQAVEKAAESTDYWTDAIGNYDKGAMEAVYTTEELVEMGFKTEDALGAAADGADEAGEKISKYGEETEQAGDKSKEFQDKSTDAVSSLNQLLASAGIAYAVKEIATEFSEASDAASEFTTSIAKLTTVADTTVLSADQLSGQISALSQDMAQNVNDLADSAYNAISAGVDTADAVSTVGTATELAVAGFTSTESSLSVLTTALNAYKMEASELTNISDSLVTSQNLGVLTIDQLSSSIGKAISTASAYSVDLYNLESGYISLTKAGISVEESTTYISSMFNELGDAGSNVSKILQEETGETFGQLMAQGNTLADTLEILSDNVNGDSEALMNLWGSAEAGKASNAIINQGLETFNSNLEQLQNSSGATASAYETMTGTTEFATQRMENSFENLKIAIGDDLNPTVTEFQNGLADLTDRFTNLVEKHPAITAGIVGVATGFGALTLAVTGYSFATTIAIPAAISFSTAIGVGLAPLVAATAGIGLLAAGVIYFTQKMEEEQDMSDKFTTSSRRMQEELDNLNAEYDEVVEKYGKNSDEAYALRMKIDDLNDSFENSKRTIGDFQNELESLSTSISDTYQKFDEAVTSNGQLEYSSLSLVTQLETLASKSSHTDAEIELMGSIVDNLNGSYEGLNLTLDETHGKLNISIADLYQAVKDSADESKKQAATDALVQAMQDYDAAQIGYREVVSNSTAAWNDYQTAESQWIEDHPIRAQIVAGAEMNWDSNLGGLFNEWEAQKDEASGYSSELNDLEYQIMEYCDALGYTKDETEEFIENMKNAAVSAEDLAEQEEELVSENEAVTEAVDGVSERLQTMAEAYDEAYRAAQESIAGQYSLWDSVSEVVSMTSQEITDALQSQIDYWNSYNANLDTLTDKASSIEGLSDVLAAVADGSEDSAAMLSGMASMSDEQLQNMVDQYTSLQTSQDDTAESMADLQADFSASLDAMQKDMEDAVSAMNMADVAEAAAKATLDGYISGIKSKTVAVNSALSAIKFTSSNIAGLTGYATGTDSAEAGLKLVGEEGPEIIDFEGGERVYNAAETSDIMYGESQDSNFYVAPEDSGNKESGSVDKTITLKIEGSGDMRIGSNMSKEDVLNLLMENMKDVLMNILHQEVLEEGEMSYEF